MGICVEVTRGGLWHVKATTHQLFCALEYQIRESLSLFSKTSLPAKDQLIKDKLATKMCSSTG